MPADLTLRLGITLSDRVWRWLESFSPRPCPPHPAVTLAFSRDPQGAEIMSLLKLEVGQQAVVHLSPKDRHGNPASVDGVPVWMIDDSGIIDIKPADDGMSAVVRQTGFAGQAATLTASVDADLGEGTRTITGVLSVAIVGSEAVAMELTADAPSDFTQAQ